ncbi:hypothetical protein PND79_20525, partial [Flavonifractor plautii]|nr:hypothetical protein [Flavonifractor plautii]MDB7917320.1 hypothetical protein [Flavonifractor plautii]
IANTFRRFWPFSFSIQFYTFPFVLICVPHNNTPSTGCPVKGVHITSHDAELRLFYAARRILKEKLDGKPIALKAWKQEYAQLKTEYAELSPQHKPLREEVIRLRQVQNAVDTALRRREQPQAVQRKKHEMEL